MSYSYSVQAATKEEAATLAEAEFDKVIATQPVHARDKEAALANVASALKLITDTPPEGQVYRVNVNGYLGWFTNTDQYDLETVPLGSVGISVSIGVGPRF